MAQQPILSSDNLVVNEAFHIQSGKFLYTSFFLISDNEEFYVGKLPIRRSEVTPEQCMSALFRVPDEEICPKMPSSPSEPFLTFNPTSGDSPDLYIKRPGIRHYIEYKELNSTCATILPALLLDEARALQHIYQYPPHPNIVKYYGCRVQRNFITGLVFDKYEHDLDQHIEAGKMVATDKKPFLAALLSAVKYLHSIGMAHNDINPSNIMVNESGMPVLIDFDSCKPLGKPLTFSRGTPGWTEEDISADYLFSKASHDLYGVAKISDWFDEVLK